MGQPDIPRELPETIKARVREALALAKLDLEDVCVHLHGEHAMIPSAVLRFLLCNIK